MRYWDGAIYFKLALATVGLAMVAVPQIQTSAPLRTSFCQIEAEPSKFSTQRIEIRATIATNFEMSTLSDNSCPPSNVHVWFGNGLIDDITRYAFVESWDALSRPNTIHWQTPPPVHLEQTDEVRTMFRKMKRQEKKQGYGVATATIIGIFQYIPEGKLMAFESRQGEVWAASRFGHQLCCNARLLPERIEDIQIDKARIQ